jgi:hypothetical protein
MSPFIKISQWNSLKILLMQWRELFFWDIITRWLVNTFQRIVTIYSAQKSNNSDFLDCFKAEDNRTIYQSTNINKDFTSKYNTSHWPNGAIRNFYNHQITAIFTYWNSMELCGREQDPQVSVTCLWHCSIYCGYDGKASGYSSFMVCQATWWTSHNKPCTWLYLQHTWTTLTILKHIHYRQHIYKFTSMV